MTTTTKTTSYSALKDNYDSMLASGIAPCFEIGENIAYIDIDVEKNEFIVGGACNIGILKDFTVEYDEYFSFDENLQAVYEIAEEYYNQQ